MTRQLGPRALAVLGLLLVVACDDGTSPTDNPSLEFAQSVLPLGEARTGSVVVRNTGTRTVGPIEIVVGPVRRAGLDIPGATVTADPSEIGSLAPGDGAIVTLHVTGAEGLQHGTYSADLSARVRTSPLASAAVSFLVPVPGDLVGSIEIVGLPASLRQGDVVQLVAVVYDTLGAVVEEATVGWATVPGGIGIITASGEFVPYATGDYSIVASAGTHADTAAITVAARGLLGNFSIVGSNAPEFYRTSDLWLFGDIAYTGTWGGDRLYAWNIAGGMPVLTDSVVVSASNVNDVKISADGSFALMTQEGGSGQAVTLLDMSDPAHPTVAGAFTVSESGWHGVHNAWIEGDYAYLATNGSSPTRGLWIINVSDLANPVRVAQFYGGSSSLHDVYVRDGLAFLSHWDAGLIILDVGNGIRSGSPTNPVEVSRIAGLGGQTHNAWYWPATGYVFVGEEDFGAPGYMHVVDASDLLNPREVGSYRVAGDAPHNFWLDEERAILYLAWYSRGLHALDVSGRLLGNLELQGRRIAESTYAGDGGCFGGGGTCTWAPQLHNGYVFVSDIYNGIWKLQPNF
ncbi:MAG TPA: hypothetical protein VMN78_09090 [Longimicrobiales bacterium]|nr:hypothetical protein [Longimicrobiales bacterium]